MKKYIIISFLGLLISQWAIAQEGSIGIGTTTPDSSAALDIHSTTMGLKMPTMTSEQRDSIQNPAPGLIIYNSSDTCFNYYSGAEWLKDCGRDLAADSTLLIGETADGTSSNYGESVTSDAAGNIYVAGNFYSTIILGNDTLTSSGSQDIFIVKYNTKGEIQWAVKGGGTNFEQVTSIVADPAGNIHISGGYRSTSASFGGGVSLNKLSTSEDAFIVKYDSDGMALWAKSGGGLSTDYANDLAIDEAGNVYITGRIFGNAQFGTTILNSFGSADIFYAKYNSNGVLQWVKNGGGVTSDEARAICVNSDGEVIITGQFAHTAYFDNDTLHSNNGSYDIFVLKCDTSGTILLAQSYGGASSDYSYAVTADEQGNIYLGGYFISSAYFDSDTLVSNGGSDLFIIKMDTAGIVQWAESAGGSSTDRIYGISSDLIGNVYITGSSYSTFNWGSDTISNKGSNDVIIAKYDAQGQVLWAKSGGGSSYEVGNDVDVSLEGKVYATGEFSSTEIQFDDITIDNDNSPSYNYFLAEFNPAHGGNKGAASNLSNTQDEDPDPSNELITMMELNGSTLEITEANELVSADLSSLYSIDSTSVTNGTTINLTMNGTDISAEAILSPDSDNILVSSPNGLKAVPIESDPQVGNNTLNYLSKWNGSALVNSSSVFEDDSGNVGIGTTSPDALLEIDGGAFLAQGATGSTPVSGGGTRMMWVPDRGAFRAGTVNGTQWNETNIGINSAVVGGRWSTASGSMSFIGGGQNNTASDYASCVAGGQGNHASEFNSFIGGGTGNLASGDKSAIAGGDDNIASSNTSFVGGGKSLLARSYAEAVFGHFNTDYTPLNTSGINIADRLFVIGNGTADAARSDAVTVLKNGNVGIGTSTPNATLDIRSSSPSVIIGTTANTEGAVYFGNTSHGVKRNYNNGNDVGLFTSSADVYLSSNGSSTSQFVLKNSGKVGIGTPTPDVKLQIEGGTDVSPSGGGYIVTKLGTNGQNIAIDENEIMARDNNGAANLNLNFEGGNVVINGTNTTDGHLGIGTQNPNSKLSISPSSVEPKITLYDGGSTTDHYGLGISSSQFNYHTSSSSADHVFYAAGKNGDGTELMRIKGNGNVGIGESNPGYKLHVKHAGFGLRLQHSSEPSNWWELFHSNGDNRYELWYTNALKGYFDPSSGAYSSTSDRNLKDNISPLHSVLPTLMQLQAKKYTYKSDAEKSEHLGFIAQDVENIFPQLVSLPSNDGERERPYLMNYAGFGVLAIKAIQEQQAVIIQQQSEIDLLHSKLSKMDDLESRLAQLENALLQSNASKK